MKFEQLNINTTLLNNAVACGYTDTTPIQDQVMPLLRAGSDVLACAPTGTGKTAAFLLPIMNELLGSTNITDTKALILAPTRELALQIGLEVEKYARGTAIRYALVIGGESIDDQLYLINRGVDLIVATPGRLHQLLDEQLIDLRALQFLVIDECDRMLDLGFITTIRKIVRKLPNKRQTALFSATLQEETELLGRELLRKPIKVEVKAAPLDMALINQTVYYVDKQNKMNLLLHILKEEAVPSALIFVRTRADAEKVANALLKAGLDAAALHGDLEQVDRQHIFKDFMNNRISLLVATDVAARGIDIPTLTYVFNYELPNEPETYLHRIGRTGRANKTGFAISLCSNAELRFLKPIKALIGKKKFTTIEQHAFSYAPREKGTPRNSASFKGNIRNKTCDITQSEDLL